MKEILVMILSVVVLSGCSSVVKHESASDISKRMSVSARGQQ